MESRTNPAPEADGRNPRKTKDKTKLKIMSQAASFCDALSEAGFVPGIVVANQAAAPIAQEGAGVFSGA